MVKKNPETLCYLNVYKHTLYFFFKKVSCGLDWSIWWADSAPPGHIFDTIIIKVSNVLDLIKLHQVKYEIKWCKKSKINTQIS